MVQWAGNGAFGVSSEKGERGNSWSKRGNSWRRRNEDARARASGTTAGLEFQRLKKRCAALKILNGRAAFGGASGISAVYSAAYCDVAMAAATDTHTIVGELHVHSDRRVSAGAREGGPHERQKKKAEKVVDEGRGVGRSGFQLKKGFLPRLERARTNERKRTRKVVDEGGHVEDGAICLLPHVCLSSHSAEGFEGCASWARCPDHNGKDPS
ncbi:hypothetical protein AXG93_2891s1530 [Marchantia polymorpha subsp. ruderalis]|uniref:Uncharacterized protein n=1 Tax=Marchantia polymorpha subsp. ruderalis TaxID=1480154 RepID=A0A176WLT5_MARPO|nr:hypothetical protein AXG93_2891s1530 [Marchantia polymorpha subsp. ruderalis]